MTNIEIRIRDYAEAKELLAKYFTGEENQFPEHQNFYYAYVDGKMKWKCCDIIVPDRFNHCYDGFFIKSEWIQKEGYEEAVLLLGCMLLQFESGSRQFLYSDVYIRRNGENYRVCNKKGRIKSHHHKFNPKEIMNGEKLEWHKIVSSEKGKGPLDSSL